MKKLLLTMFVASITFGAFAQFQMGLKGGLNISSVTPGYFTSGYDDNAEQTVRDFYNDYTSSKMGMNIALVLNTGGKVFSFQPEFAYSQRGYSMLDIDKKYAGKFNMNYFDIKPMFNIGGGGDNWKVYAHFGPSINIWLSRAEFDKDGKYIANSDEWGTDSDEAGSGEYDFRLDLGLVLGIGAKYKVGPGWILFNPRYEWGILPSVILDLGSDGYSLLNRTLSINVGYLYEF